MNFKDKFNGDLPNYIDNLRSAQKEYAVSEKAIPNLPEKDVIIDILNELKQLLFPSYAGNKTAPQDYNGYETGYMMKSIYHKLKGQLVFIHLYENNHTDDTRVDHAEEWAENICSDFFKQLPEIYRMLITDVQAAFDGDPAAESKEQIVFSYPGFEAITTHRIAHALYNLNVPMIPRIMSEYTHSRTGVDLHPGAKVGEYFFIDHATGVVVGETSEIGNHVKIYQGVTIGALSLRNGRALSGKKRHPTIENNVTIYSGASVLGGNTVIGENTVIGGGAFITESVPANMLVSPTKGKLEFKECGSCNLKEPKDCLYKINKAN
ncbi:MAG: serine O-acetyltransferase [Eubacteriales bacterium]|nr:serine O-acetyltransferase [Eubacteriales bacterium]MDD4389243.1 serine O-acetyltransferase [Eubacteriales bacterium]